jgi:phospholipase C
MIAVDDSRFRDGNDRTIVTRPPYDWFRRKYGAERDHRAQRGDAWALVRGKGIRMKYRQSIAYAATAFALIATGAAAQEGMRDQNPKTPIKHLVVIFQENISFDHYFGTYPMAENKPGEMPFMAKGSTPRRINNLLTPLDTTNRSGRCAISTC